jgi:PhzF family phenazine biosynthesis protein
LDLPIFQVDAFAAKVFEGNPAAVCPLQEWLEEKTLQTIAAENNLSETAFFVPEGDGYRLRWFTPQCEVELCGHATLASAFVILNILTPQKSSVQFETRSGLLTVHKDGDLLSMDFPASPPWKSENPPADLSRALVNGNSSGGPTAVFQTKSKFLAVYENEEQILNAHPNFELLKALHPFTVCITAPGSRSDFVSRYFAPSYGIPEDPVTGSSHCTLAPYWAARLNKTKFHARQVSEREGELWCELKKDRVILKGKAVLYLSGSISI